MNTPLDDKGTTGRVGNNSHRRNGHQGLYNGVKEVLTNEGLAVDLAEQCLTWKARGKEVNDIDYVLGHSQREIRRLRTQAAILRPITERLLRNVKIGPGMRVLDLGCGAGDASMLAAEFVGPTGLVVGIDRSPEVLAVAAERAQAAGLRQVSF